MEHIVAVLALALICAVWVALQLTRGKSASERTATSAAAGACTCFPGSTCNSAERGPDCDTLTPTQRRLWLGLVAGFGLIVGGAMAFHVFNRPHVPPTPTAAGTLPDVRAERYLMGTQWAISATPPPGRSADDTQEIVARAFAEVARVETTMSEWIPTSPISQINANAGVGAVEVPAELRAIIERGMRLGELSDGAFDLTWKGMGKLWDFRAEDFAPPDEATIRDAIARVDFRAITIAGNHVGLPRPGMAIGLGGIAKGYGVDRAAAVLRDAGIERFYIDGGGDVLVASPISRPPWRIGIRDPRGGPTEMLLAIELHNGAVATSGDYERFRELDGVRYHHILDVRTGRPAMRSQACTIVAPTSEAADALATAVFVLGPEAGMALADAQPNTHALVVAADGTRHLSAGFRRLVSTR